jgi:acetoin utilization deacetylase AcuC-like enzyme
LLSAGFDACVDDPVGDIGLDPAIFSDLTKRLVQVTNDIAGGRIVSLLEGGYNLKRLGEAASHHVAALANE